MTVGSGAENYGVVFALGVSPRKAGLLWAGTDDGKLWVTEDEGGNWTDLTANLPAPAKDQWIARIEPGHADDKVAYLVGERVSRRATTRRSSIARPTSGAPGRASRATCPPPGRCASFARIRRTRTCCLRARRSASTRASIAGRRGCRSAALPAVPVDDILVHPREHDLVIATHGRSLYIVDDISALERLTAPR